MCNNRAGYMKASTWDEIMDTSHRGYCSFLFDGLWKHYARNSHSAANSSPLAGASGSTCSGGCT
jgi:hypothetical protein